MPSSQEIDLALTLLRGYHKDHAKQLLHNHGQPTSGTWDTVLERLRDALTKHQVPFDELVRTIDSVEEHGHHHVFLFTLPEQHTAPLRDPKHIARLVEEQGQTRLLNATTRVVDKPSKPTCTSINHTPQALRLKWVEKREWMEHVKGADKDEGKYVLLKMERHEARAVNTLRINLTTREVELRISDAGKESRGDYSGALQDYEQATGWLLPWDKLERVDVHAAIPKVLALPEDEVSIRGDTYHTDIGSKASYTSHSVDADVREDPDYQGAGAGRDHLQVHVTWLPKAGSGLAQKVRAYLYADGLGNEVRFSASQSADEVSHVLSRIRTLAKP